MPPITSALVMVEIWLSDLDNTLFRFGWRYGFALVEETQIEEFPAA